MSARRYTTHEPCPVDDAPVVMDTCEGCRFYRGATSSRHEAPDATHRFPHGWDVCCNWPRDGAYVAAGGEGREGPGIERAVGGGSIPPIFLAGFDEEAAA